MPWSLLEGPAIDVVLGAVLAVFALALLREYRRIFFANPIAAMSAEVLMPALFGTGGPGYLAAFLLAGAGLSFAFALVSFVLNVFSYINR